jgi:predicted  nucleic acid-binding Zn-ribbon protein
VLPELAALIALQRLDTAAEAARRRQAELPAAEAAAAARLADAARHAETSKARLADNGARRRALEKDVAVVDTRMARFNDHKAAVKTNQEYTALLHEIDTARSEKDGIEERILLLMEEADAIASELRTAEAALREAERDAERTRVDNAAEGRRIDDELARLAGARRGEAAALDAGVLARYEQLLKVRKGVAVAPMVGEICSACFVRLRPHVTQQIRRNDEVRQCENCQRILYYEPPADGA